METRASYIAVGVAVLAIAAFAVGFIIWMGGRDTVAAYERYWIDFEGSVAGLRIGSRVTYRGITVGQVTALRIKPENVEKVRATIEIDGATPVKTDTIASLEVQGLAGGAVIELSGGTQEAPPLPRPEEGLPIIQSEPSSLEQLFEGAPALVEKVDALVSRALLLLNDQNQQAISNIIQNSERLTTNLAKASEPAEALVLEARNTIRQVAATANRLEKLSVTAEEQLQKSFAGAGETLESTNAALGRAAEALINVERAAAQMGDASAQLEALIAENRTPIRDFTNVTLYDAQSFIAEMRELAISLRQVVNELNRDPSGFLFGNQQRGYEAR